MPVALVERHVGGDLCLVAVPTSMARIGASLLATKSVACTGWRSWGEALAISCQTAAANNLIPDEVSKSNSPRFTCAEQLRFTSAPSTINKLRTRRRVEELAAQCLDIRTGGGGRAAAPL
jgi:hypothetical protein